MPNLWKHDSGSTEQWSTGSSPFFTDESIGSRRVATAIYCKFGSLRNADRALLDTGATWSVIGGDLLQLVEPDLGAASESITMNTRQGDIKGLLRELRITLPSEHGNDLEIDAKVVTVPDWMGPPVLGFHGFLESIRFALEPAREPVFYFGAQ